jgi:hypothetical protein
MMYVVQSENSRRRLAVNKKNKGSQLPSQRFLHGDRWPQASEAVGACSYLCGKDGVMRGSCYNPDTPSAKTKLNQ